MLKLFSNPIPFYNTPESNAGGGELTVSDIYDALGDDKEETIELDDDKDKSPKKDDEEADKEPDKKPKGGDKEVEDDEEEDTEESDNSKEDEDDELEELVEDLEEPDEEKLELVTPVRRKEILKKFPTLFKEFPYLEKAMYREQQFSEIVPTIDDAKEAVAKAETLDKFEGDLSSGNTEIMLRAVKQSNPKAFGKIVDNYLTVLSKVDKDAFLHVTGNTIKHTIMQMASEARRNSDNELHEAAAILNKFVFGTTEFVPPTKLTDDKDDKVNPREEELNRREMESNQKEFNRVSGELNTKINNALTATINKNIDPKESMSDYVRRNASREAMETLTDLINKDNRFKIILDKLWDHAIKNDYSVESVDKIRSAFYSKAKTLLPSVIKKARNEALRGMGKRIRDDSPDKESNTRDSKGEKSHPRVRGDKSESGKVPKGMSTLDFLMSD